MDPGDLDSSLPQPDNPCLIVEDSQPDSVALEDDPESSYRALLARRLSTLQPSSRSPVLELISSPLGSRSSQTDSENSENSQSNNQEPGTLSTTPPSSVFQEDSQVLNIRPRPNHKTPEDTAMDSGADSTTHCRSAEEGTSQFGFLELSQTQDLCSEAVNSQGGAVSPQPDSERRSQSEHSTSSRTSANQDKTSVRSEVSSSDSVSHSARPLSVQDLLHSEGLQASAEQEQLDRETPSSQEDMFDADKTGAAVDSTVSEQEQGGHPTPTPSHMRLLHLSGQGPLVQDSLSQSSADYVAPTPDNFSHTPLIVPSSPTGPEPGHGADEPMDGAMPREDGAGERENRPMETEAVSKPHPSTAVSQHAPGFALDRTLSLPSQPEFSHDVFVPTQSLERPHETESQHLETAGLCLSAQPVEDDSQATQIEDLEAVDTGDSGTLSREQRSQDNGVPPASQTSSQGSDVHDKTVSLSVPTETPPCSLSPRSVFSAVDLGEGAKSRSAEPESQEDMVEQGEELSAAGGGASGMALALSQSQAMSPEPMEDQSEKEGADDIITVADSERPSPILKKGVTNSSQPIRVIASASTNGHESQLQVKVNAAPDRLSQTERAGPEAEALKDKSLSDSSGEISFHFTLPKDGELIGPAAGATPPLLNQLKQTLRHSTPIEVFSEKLDNVGGASGDPARAASGVSGEAEEDKGAEPGDKKLSLRMKLVTPVEEGSSESFSLQKPALSGEDTPVVQAVPSSSVFSRVRQVHRQEDDRQEDDRQEDDRQQDVSTPVRAELFPSPRRSSQASSLGCISQLEASQQNPVSVHTSADQSEGRRGPQPPTPNRRDARQKTSSQKTFDNTGEPESPSFRRTTGPAHCRHVRTIQEVRTTITRIITDVYYEDGKEVDRKVTEESEEPVVDCHVLDSDVSPCRTGSSSSLTSGDLGDISSLSSKASSFTRPDFIMPSSRGGRSFSPRRGGGYQQRGHRGQRAGAVVAKDRGYGPLGSRAFVPLTPRGRARRGRPPSRSSLSRGGGVGSLQRLAAHGPLQSSSEDEPFTRMLPPRLPVSPADAELPSRSDSLGSSPEEASPAGSSFVGLRVVAKWSSNGYFYSGRIIRDAGEGRFRLRFDDGYECEVVGKDILLCDPIPLETEVTALLEDEYFSIGVVRGHKSEGQELFYSVERDGQRQWHNRTAVILSLEQGNRLREQHSLGPYEPSTPLAKASDISLDNLVEGKRRRRVTPGGQDTPDRSSSSSPRTPGPSGKRKLRTTCDGDSSPAKRGRRVPAQRVGACNTSGSGTDLPAQSADASEALGPLPQNTSLFMGFAFMLTASSESDRLTNQLTEEEEDTQTSAFNKAYTEAQLQGGGGFILPDFNEEQCKAAYQSLLIADQHCRTRKYLLCLASGVPCVSHVWVRDCCKENKLLNYRNYLLPAGVGPDDAVVEWHPRCSPFKSLRVLLVFEKPAELWAQLITMGGASSVRQLQADRDGSAVPAGKYDAVVTDHACPPLVEESVTSQEVPLVSPEWLIESVICGERLGFHSKAQYRHDYSS